MSPTRGWQLPTLLTTLDDLPKLTTVTFIGIMVAITGNVLISFALNLQKLAHIRVEVKRRNESQQNGKKPNESNTEHRRSEGPSLNEADEDRPQTNSGEGHTQPTLHVETQSLIPFPRPQDYGTRSDDAPRPRSLPTKRRLFAPPFRPEHENMLLPVDVISEETGQSSGKKTTNVDVLEEGSETDYLKSKLWQVIYHPRQLASRPYPLTRWLGFLLLNVGEMGNFISYAWAPASVVAPLGTVSSSS